VSGKVQPGGWREAVPELIITGIAATALCGAAYAFAGTAAAVVTLAALGVAALVVMRWLGPADDNAPPGYDEPETERTRTTFVGFWRRRAGVEAATQTMTGYDYELRATLQHLLAARLAERHGISLYDNPEAARRLLASGGSDRLWYWLDPARPPVADQGRSAGIPPRTLAAIINRLERL
jgi:hypothetical protein